MEEVYVIKLKGLPLRDPVIHNQSLPLTTDISCQVLMGFGIFQIVLGLISIVFGVVSIVADWKLTAAGVGCGIIFFFTGVIGVWSAYQRRNNFNESHQVVKTFLFTSLLSCATSLIFIVLILSGVSSTEEEEASHILPHLISNSVIALSCELIVALLASFAAARTAWPSSLRCCAKDWPTQPQVKKKVIVATSIFARGIYNSQDFTRYLGPNCVVSLASPKPLPVCDGHLTLSDSDDSNESEESINNSRNNQLNQQHGYGAIRNIPVENGARLSSEA